MTNGTGMCAIWVRAADAPTVSDAAWPADDRTQHAGKDSESYAVPALAVKSLLAGAAS